MALLDVDGWTLRLRAERLWRYVVLRADRSGKSAPEACVVDEAKVGVLDVTVSNAAGVEVFYRVQDIGHD